MSITVAIVAPGEMGSAIGGVLAAAGAEVLTSLAGRSPASAARAQANGMRGASDEEIAAADIVLSILPPRDAVAMAERLAPALARSRRPVYADCNAVSPQTVWRVAEIVTATGCRFADGGIIGLPPEPPEPGPKLYVSGPDAAALTPLRDLGLDLRVLDAPVGAASALKMSYAGITKGMTAICTAMILGAIRNGAGPDLARELADSQQATLKRVSTTIPNMFPKAYRWVGEMREIAAFLGEEDAAHLMYEGASGLYDHIARDREGDGPDLAALREFLKLANGM